MGSGEFNAGTKCCVLIIRRKLAAKRRRKEQQLSIREESQF
jgi:hypothetical protein